MFSTLSFIDGGQSGSTANLVNTPPSDCPSTEDENENDDDDTSSDQSDEEDETSRSTDAVVKYADSENNIDSTFHAGSKGKIESSSSTDENRGSDDCTCTPNGIVSVDEVPSLHAVESRRLRISHGREMPFDCRLHPSNHHSRTQQEQEFPKYFTVVHSERQSDKYLLEDEGKYDELQRRGVGRSGDTRHFITDLVERKFRESSDVKLFDAAILYGKRDREEVSHFRDVVKQIVEEDLRQELRIELFDSDQFEQSSFLVVEDLVDRSSAILVYLSPNANSQNFFFVLEEALGLTRLSPNRPLNKQFILRPVHTQPPSQRTYKTPVGLFTVRGIDWYDKHSAYTRYQIVSAMKAALAERKVREDGNASGQVPAKIPLQTAQETTSRSSRDSHRVLPGRRPMAEAQLPYDSRHISMPVQNPPQQTQKRDTGSTTQPASLSFGGFPQTVQLVTGDHLPGSEEYLGDFGNHLQVSHMWNGHNSQKSLVNGTEVSSDHNRYTTVNQYNPTNIRTPEVMSTDGRTAQSVPNHPAVLPGHRSASVPQMNSLCRCQMSLAPFRCDSKEMLRSTHPNSYGMQEYLERNSEPLQTSRYLPHRLELQHPQELQTFSPCPPASPLECSTVNKDRLQNSYAMAPRQRPRHNCTHFQDWIGHDIESFAPEDSRLARGELCNDNNYAMCMDDVQDSYCESLRHHDTPHASQLKVVSRLTGKLIVNPDLSTDDVEVDSQKSGIYNSDVLENQNDNETDSRSVRKGRGML